MARTATYFIAQHLSDVFRREPRNVGIVVELDGAVTARFAGETQPGTVDRRKVQRLEEPGVYAQWVKYWRRTLTAGGAIEKIKRTAVGHYRVIDGGSVESIGADNADDVASYLYAMLVSEGGLAEAMGDTDETDDRMSRPRLGASVSNAFAEAHILGDPGLLNVRYPVRTGMQVRGVRRRHSPEFVQPNHALTVMQTIDFTSQRKESAKDRAGWASYMFSDIHEQDVQAIRIAIVRARDEDKADRNVAYGLDLLRDTSTEVVDWLDADQRVHFIAERVSVATTQG